MGKQIFVNLPVSDLEKAKSFHLALGHTINPKFTNDDAASIVVSDSIYFMLLKREFFQGFLTDRAICDTSTHVEVLIALPVEDRAAVDATIARAIAAGGCEAGTARDYGFMYQRSFADPDGHVFEIFHMDEAAFPGA